METHEVGGSPSPHGGRGTEAQSPSAPDHPRLIDGDRALRTTDQHVEHESRQEPHDDDVDRVPCTTGQHISTLLARLSELCRPRHLAAPALRSACRA